MRLLVFCLLGAVACSNDDFVTSVDDAGNPLGDASGGDSTIPPGADGGKVEASIPDSSLLGPFCTVQHPTAIYCADWDKSTNVTDAYPTPWSMPMLNGTLVSTTSQSPVSAPNALHVAFSSASGSTLGYVFKDGFGSSLMSPHLSFMVRSGIQTTVDVGAIIVHFAVSANDFPVIIQITNGTDYHVLAPAILQNQVCEMGTLGSPSNAWHHVEVWLANGKVGCKLDNMQSGSVGAFALSNGLVGFGIQAGELSSAPSNSGGEVSIDNLLFDGNPPM